MKWHHYPTLYRDCHQKHTIAKSTQLLRNLTVWFVLGICSRARLPDALVRFFLRTRDYDRSMTPSREAASVWKRPNLHAVESRQSDVCNAKRYLVLDLL